MERSKNLEKKLREVISKAKKALDIYHSEWNYHSGFNYKEFERFVYGNLDPHNIYDGEELWGMKISYGELTIKWDMENIILESPGYFRRLRKDSRAYEILAEVFYTLWVGW